MSGVNLLAIVALCFTVVSAQPPTPIRIAPAVIGAGSGPRMCPADDLLQQARMNSSAAAQDAIRNSPCGGVGWAQVAYFDMTDPTQMCPTAWQEYAAPSRSCSIPAAGCVSVFFPVPQGTYTRICGAALGYETGTPDGFFSGQGIDGIYMDGLSITIGTPRQHVWSFVGGHGPEFGAQNIRCPCDNTNGNSAPLPAFVGQNYFCEGDYNGRLWDQMDCNPTYAMGCCIFNNPPFFNVTLPAPSSDSIEARICADQGRGDEAVNIESLQLYVQ